MSDAAWSPEAHLVELTQKWVGSILIMGSVLFPVLGFMDYFVSPENFIRFMIYRLVVAALLLFLYYLNQLKRKKSYQYTIASIGATLSAVTVELAVLQSGGGDSSYYGAMIILAICCLGFAPINMAWSFFLVGLVYTIYVVPILLTNPVITGLFVSHNVFMVSTFVIGLLLRYNNQKMLVSELRLRAELSEDKRKLEAYSCSLKDEVVEKSGALAITEQKYRALFDNANDGIVVLDRFGNITDVNHRFCELHGFASPSVLGTNFRLFEIESSRGEIDERLKKILAGESLVYEAQHYRKDGSTILLEISSRAIDLGGVPHIQSFLRDITEKMRLQEQVLQSQKMESLGVLAGGIAHDFQNVLTAILAHTEVLRRHVNTDDFGKRRVKTIEDAAKRAGQLVSKLLSFARKESIQLVASDLNGVVRDSVDLLGRALMDQDIRIRMMLDPDLPAIYGDGIQLEQVIANLVMNARDAMSTGGTITISTEAREITPDSPPVSPFLTAGKYAVLSVKDTGTGIARDIMDKIFDPFFTTKPAGKGTGLGLAMVYGIVKSHKGAIRVDSRENTGTQFDIYLPVADQPVMADSASWTEPAAAVQQTVCVIDGDKETLSSIKDMLESEGLRVIAIDDPKSVSEMLARTSERIDAVLTEIVLPGMNGTELANRIKASHPGVKVIGMSGLEGRRAAQAAPSIDFFLNKPFDRTSLLSALRAALDQGQQPAAQA